MNQIKDFIYNTSDLVVALVIIFVVAYIISWKVGVISAYTIDIPSEISEPSNHIPNPSVVLPEPETESEAKPETEPEAETEPEPAENIKIKIPSGSSSKAIASILKERGLIESTSAFSNRTTERKLDSKLRAGTFYIPSNASTDEVINILTGQ